jgi:hypothetical protein
LSLNALCASSHFLSFFFFFFFGDIGVQTQDLFFNFKLFLIFKTHHYFIIIIVLVVVWGYIVTSTKALTLYYSGIHPLHHSHLFHPWNMNLGLTLARQALESQP